MQTDRNERLRTVMMQRTNMGGKKSRTPEQLLREFERDKEIYEGLMLDARKLRKKNYKQGTCQGHMTDNILARRTTKLSNNSP